LLFDPSTGTPPAGMLGEGDFQPITGTQVLSPDASTWIGIDLQPGTYALMCFIPDRSTGMPHAMLGMVSIVTVS
jgi:hypothetical protein